MPIAAQAQRIERVKQRLAQTSVGDGGRAASVKVRESGSAADAVRRGDAATQQSVNGFRIVIFFDNSATARADAERKMSEFMAAYPDVRCDIRYENPYFKVVAGSCVSSDEAVMLLERVHRDFPESYIMREEIAVQNLIAPKRNADSDSMPDDDSPEAAADSRRQQGREI